MNEKEAVDEFDRQRRLVDQMSTMHSLMRDKCRLDSTVILCVLLSASALATAFAFAAGDDEVSLAGISAERVTWLGWFAILIFVLTLVDLVVDRRGAATRHGDALRQLAILKAEYRARPDPSELVTGIGPLTERYQTVMDALPPIPERQFNSLKAKHLEKVEISRYLSAHPGLSVRKARAAVRKAAEA